MMTEESLLQNGVTRRGSDRDSHLVRLILSTTSGETITPSARQAPSPPTDRHRRALSVASLFGPRLLLVENSHQLLDQILAQSVL